MSWLQRAARQDKQHLKVLGLILLLMVVIGIVRHNLADSLITFVWIAAIYAIIWRRSLSKKKV